MNAAPTAELPTVGVAGHGPVEPREAGAALVRWLALLIALLALALGLLLWQRLGHTQEQLARQSAEALASGREARERSLDAQGLVRDAAARLALLEARVRELALQRAQIEALVQSLSRSSNENLVADLESTLRFAQQQAQLTGSAGPLLAALKSVAQRIDSAAQPRLAEAQRAVERDLDRLNSTQLMDTARLAARIDEVMRLADDLPLANTVGSLSAGERPLDLVSDSGPAPPPASWWRRVLDAVLDETRKLLRVARIDQPEAALLTPEQGFFVRENIKLLLQSARLRLLARQFETARADLAAASALLNKYFDAGARKTQFATGLLQQLRGEANAAELPRIDDALSALTALSASAAAAR